MADKQKRYQDLITKRKAHKFQEGLRNPSESQYDGNYVDPWEQWQNDLDADIMVVGQEFSDFSTFQNIQGTVERFNDRFEYPSNKNLRAYLALIGYDPGHPMAKDRANSLFITNTVMGLKDGSMSSNFKDKWMTESRNLFLRPLIELVDPKAIICVGSKPAQSVLRVFGLKPKALRDLIQESPITTSGKLIFPVYHTGGLGLANRKRELQLEDWKKITKYL